MKREEQKEAPKVKAIEKEKSRRENIKEESFKVLAEFDDENKIPDKKEESAIARQKKKIKILEYPKVSIMPDRLNLPKRERSGIILAVGEALGHNIDEISTSKAQQAEQVIKFNSKFQMTLQKNSVHPHTLPFTGIQR